MTSIKVNRRLSLIVALPVLSWLGLLVHNSIEGVDGSTGIMAIVAAVLIMGWSQPPSKRAATYLLLFWGTGHLVGGAVVTVIPFDFLPFAPEQTLVHYFAHLFYGLAQLPLIVVVVQELRS